MRYLIFVLVILLAAAFSPCASAASLDNATVQSYVSVYNSRIDNAPQILKSILGNERIELEIANNDGSISKVGFETENARINKTVEGGVADPTISINATADAISRIRSSDDPISTFKEEMNRGSIVIQGNTLAAKLKLGAVLSSTDVLKFFYNIFFG